MKIPVPVLGALAVLTVAAPAGAKGLPPSQICGATECVQLDRSPESAIILDHDATTPAPLVSGYYRVAYAAPGVGQHLFVPSGNRLAVETAGGRALQWYALYGTGPERLRQAISELEPIAPPARWSDSIEVAAPTGGRDWLRYVLAGCGILALVAGGGFAHRIRLRPPEPRNQALLWREFLRPPIRSYT